MSTVSEAPANRPDVQVRRRPPEPPRKGHFWLNLIVSLAFIAAGYFGYRYYVASKSTKSAETRPTTGPNSRPVPVVSAPVTRGDFPIYLERDGTVTALNTVVVHTRVDGQLMKVAYTEGQEVHEGDLLAEIDPRPFQVQLEQAQGQLAKDQATLENAQRDLARYELAKDAIPQQQIDTAQASVAEAEGAVKSDQAQIDSAKLQLIYCKVTAPISGRVGLRTVDVGNIVHAADTNGLVTLTQIHPISLVFSFTQDTLEQVQQAMQDNPGKVRVDALDKNAKKRLATGTLAAIDNQIDTTTDTYRLKGLFDNEENTLFPNQFVNARVLVDTRKGVILVPTAAVQTSPTSTFVYVIKADDTVEMRPITLGPISDNVDVVDRGLTDGETVVIDGLDKLQQGSKVTARSADQPQTQRRRK